MTETSDYLSWKPKALNLSLVKRKNRLRMMEMVKNQNSISTELGKGGIAGLSSLEDSMDKSTVMNSKS